jgi:NADH-quinone oxidoreductase subunit J
VTAGHVLATSGATQTSSDVAFWILAIISVAAGVGMILARKAVHCALLLAVVMLSLAVLYAVLGAPFLAFVQIIVYTGAVLMLFLFVLMIVGVSALDSMRETIRGQRLAAGVVGIGLLVLLSLIIGHAAIGPAPNASPSYGTNNLRSLSVLIFTRYVFAFEVTSALLITAALGAMVLAHRERTSPKPTQREMSGERMTGGHPTPLPGPGVYARHNAVDMPALLPDGSPSRLSVSPVIARGGIGRAGVARASAELTGAVVTTGDPAAAGDGERVNGGQNGNGDHPGDGHAGDGQEEARP